MKKRINGTQGIAQFLPHLVVEVTNACNLRCAGCYASNVYVVNNESVNESCATSLTPIAFERALNQLDKRIAAIHNPIVALRGGEPTLSPNLHSIVSIARNRHYKIVIETNGLWVLKANNNSHYSSMLDLLARDDVIIKLSFDFFHGTTFRIVHNILNIASSTSLNVEISVTAVDVSEFHEIQRCLDIPKGVKCYYQEFVQDAYNITSPPLGIINCKGELLYDFGGHMEDL